MNGVGRVLTNLSSRELGGSLCASAVSHLLLLVPTLVTLQIYDRVLSSHSGATLLMLLVAAALSLGSWSLVESSRNRWHAAKASDAAQVLERQVMPWLMRAPIHQMGAMAAQTWSDIDAVRNFAGGPLLLAAVDLPWSLVYLVVLGAFHPLLGAVALGAVALMVALAWFTEWRVRRASEAAQQGQLDLQRKRGEIVAFAEVVQAHGQQHQIEVALGAIQAHALQMRLNAQLPVHSLRTISKLMRQGLQIAVLATGAWLVIGSEATGGVMIAGSILLGKALMPLEILIGGSKQVLCARSAATRLQRTLAEASAQPLEPETELPPSGGALRVSSLGVRARPGEPSILHDLSFQLPPGAQLAVIGSSGSGKSTLARVLAGALHPTLGEVTLDGAALHQYGSRERGRSTGYLPQEVLLHSGTVAHNIARLWQPAEPMTPQQSQAVVEAARQAGVHELITALPQGYDTLLGVGQSAKVLSGGQRQRIALARALYAAPGTAGPSLVVLDEPSSQLDADGQRALASCMRRLREAGTTVVVITHRAQVIEQATHVLVLRHGRLASFGPREQVRKRMVQRPSGAPPHQVAAV